MAAAGSPHAVPIWYDLDSDDLVSQPGEMAQRRFEFKGDMAELRAEFK